MLYIRTVILVWLLYLTAYVIEIVTYFVNFRVEGGELFERVIGDDFVLTEKAVTIFMRQICEGVQFIHSKNILHLDLKVHNIKYIDI